MKYVISILLLTNIMAAQNISLEAASAGEFVCSTQRLSAEDAGRLIQNNCEPSMPMTSYVTGADIRSQKITICCTKSED